jgi:transcriptional regulator with XRE-family HTH domain
MSDVNVEIGLRIKGVRELNDLSLVEFAKNINTDTETLVKYERGETEIPVSALRDIAGVTGISMTELITGENAKLSVYSVVRKGRGVGVDRREAYDYKSLAYNFANRRMDPFLITIEPKPDGDPIHLTAHGGQEFHYCVEGSFLIKIDKYEIVIEEGDAIYFDSARPHGMKALNGKAAKELVIIT